MQPTNKSRDRLAVGLSFALGLTVAGALKMSFLVPADASLQAQGVAGAASAPVRVRTRATTAPAIPAPDPVPTRSKQPLARPVSTSGSVPRKVAIQADKAAAPTIAPEPRIEIAPNVAFEQPANIRPVETPPALPALEQPAIRAPDVPAVVVAPVIGSEAGLPAAPPDDYAPPPETFAEQPGGEVLVLGLLVDSTGTVLDSRILVPSHNGLGDLSYAMVARRERLTDITPPILPGEPRWVQVRVRFPMNQTQLP